MAPEEKVEMSQKKTKLSLLPYNSLFSSLPNELVVNCFARIPKWYYPSLSLVSTNFRSLILSPDLYVARSQIGTTEICLYICLRFFTGPSMKPTRRWFNLWIKPNRNRTDGRVKKKSSGNLLVPFNNSSPPYSNSTVTVGSEIYVFGGSLDDNFGPSSVVRVYDCRKDTWRDVPNMKMERKHALACVLDDKIYVMGGCSSEHSSWFEMFDTKTKIWKTLPTNPDLQIRFGNIVRKIDVMEGKIYVKTQDGIKNWIYDVKEGRWSDTEEEMNIMWPNSWCVIDNVMFCYTFTTYKFKWYDLEARKWKDVSGLQALKKYRSCSVVGFPNSVVELVNYDGKLAILWDRFERPGRSLNKNIWCAVVRLEKYHGEILGKIEWVDVVLTVPKSYNFLRCLAIPI